MSATQFRLAKSGALAPPETYSTVDLALAAGRLYWPKEPFKVQEVRSATLADFIVPANVVGDIREQMAAKIGTDGPLEEAISGTGEQRFDPDDFGAELRVFANAYADATGLTFKDFYIVEREHVVTPTEPEPEAEA